MTRSGSYDIAIRGIRSLHHDAKLLSNVISLYLSGALKTGLTRVTCDAIVFFFVFLATDLFLFCIVLELLCRWVSIHSDGAATI